MSIRMRQQWQVSGESLPIVWRSCPKCGQKTEFVNSGKFRVNGNGRLLDVWLIYRCRQCKSTWNMSIYERVAPDSIERKEYEGFLQNAPELVRAYGTSRETFIRNGAEVLEAPGGYTVKRVEMPTPCALDGTEEIEIKMDGSLRLRADALFAQQLNLSRNQVKQLFERQQIICDGKTVTAASRVRDGQVFVSRQLFEI